MSGFSSKFSPYLAWAEKFDSGLSQAKSFVSSSSDNFPLTFDRIFYVGMGGSGAAGLICQDILSRQPDVSVELVSCDALTLPQNPSDTDLFMLVSHSGNTWEVLEAFNSLMASGAKCLVLAGGGQLLERAEQKGVPLQKIEVKDLPRQDLPVFIGFLLGTLLGAKKIGQNLIDDIKLAVSKGLKALGGDFFKEFVQIFGGKDFFHIFYVFGDCNGAAIRAKNQFCENSKARVSITPLTEGFHNSFAAFEDGAGEPVLFFRTQELGQNIKNSLDCAKNILSEGGVALYTAPVLGNNWLEQFIWLVIWSDFASVDLAEKNGKDPDSVMLIDSLKNRSKDKIKV